ncbi:MAG: hypothetical protein ACE5JI_17565 [Acidobacteriota bacterium]
MSGEVIVMRTGQVWGSRFACIAVAFGVSAAAAGAMWGQSLAEVAQKEKERRSEVKKEGQAKVITARELQSYGGFPPAPPPAAPSTASRASGGEAQEAEGAETEEAASDESKTREHWQERVQAVQDKIQDLESQLNSPELSWGGGMRTDVNPLGFRNLSRRQELEKQLAEARAELDAIRLEARRAGVPAGWVR